MNATLVAMVLSCVLISNVIQANVASASSVQSAPLSKKINLNTAEVPMLLHAVKGIGQKRAEAIVAYRKAHGGFKSLDELTQVRGFGKRYVKAYWTQLQATFML